MISFTVHSSFVFARVDHKIEEQKLWLIAKYAPLIES